MLSHAEGYLGSNMIFPKNTLLLINFHISIYYIKSDNEVLLNKFPFSLFTLIKQQKVYFVVIPHVICKVNAIRNFVH